MKLTTMGYLIAGLIASLAVNVVLVWNAGRMGAKAEAASTIAEKDTTIARLQGTIRVNTALANAAATDHTALLTDLQAIADRGQQVRVKWRTQTIPALAPLDPGCAPGTARQAAFNALIAHPLGEDRATD